MPGDEHDRTSSDTCRHGLLTYERDGQLFHRYDGARCEAAPKPAPSRAPELLAYQRVGQPPGGSRTEEPPPASVPAMPPPPPTPDRPVGRSEASEPPLVEATERADAPRHARLRRGAWAALAALVLLGAGVAIGYAVRNGAVDRQHRRVTAAEQEVASLHDRVSSRQATIDDQRRQIATAREQQDELKRRNAQLREQASHAPEPTGANATSFTDGIYQSGSAIQTGQYRTDGSDSCYWAKLSAGDTNSVIDSNFGAGPQTVTIDSPYFESEGCGTWTKVG